MKLHNQVKGRYRLTVIGSDGVIKNQTKWFDNLITDGGLEYMADNSDWIKFCQVGSGSATPNALDTGLTNWIAGSDTQQATSQGAQSSEPYYVWRRRTIRFADGVAAGNISEVGMGWASNGSLFSRALVLDSGGSPTSITVGAGETLDVTYEVRFFPKLEDVTGSVVLTGNLGGTYDYVMRAAQVTRRQSLDGWEIGLWGTSMGYAAVAGFQYARSGDLSAITSEPTGTDFPATSQTLLAYETGTLERKVAVVWGPSEGNVPGGIRTFTVKLGIGLFQFRVGLDGTDATLPKTSDDQLSLTFSHSWGRAA